MNGARLRARLAAGEAISMFTPHHTHSGLSARLVELSADAVFVDCEHGTWSFEDVRATGQVVRSRWAVLPSYARIRTNGRSSSVT